MLKYNQNFSMPIIAPQSYPAVKALTTVTASGAGRYPVQIQVSNSAYWQLFSMAGGPIFFVPEGPHDPFFLYLTYPELPPLLPGTGYLLQLVWMGDIERLRSVLPEGVPPMVEIVYFNVDPTSFRADARWQLSMMRLPLSVLEGFGTIAGSPDRDAYETQLIDLMLQGKAGIFFPGGAQVGKMASANFTLFFTGDDKVGLSPIPFLRSMPTFAGDKWQGHPLIDAVATVTVPVDIYAQFQVWSDAHNGPMPFPNGLSVRLMDYTSTPHATLATLPLENGDGTVTFTLTDTQLQGTPDLLFEIDLGTANPEPGVITDPWNSFANSHSDTLYPNSGYFEKFSGTRLGSDISPLSFQIGLGFWKDLMSCRPPASVQTALQAKGRYGQPIEDAFHGFLVDPETGHGPEEIYADISLDYYGVQVKTLPPSYATPKALMDYIRTNFDKFYDSYVSVFKTSDPEWKDPNTSPVGVVLSIDFKVLWIISPDSGSVVVSGADTAGGFTVNTISVPFSLVPLSRNYHPLGGIRRWGFVTNADGSFTFFTRGADRPYLYYNWDTRLLVFDGADRLWTSYQVALKKFVNDNGGEATILPGFAQRFDWPLIKASYWSDDPNNPWIKLP